MEYNLGRVGIVPRGAFSLGTPYKALDMVTDSGNSYIARCDSTGAPLTDSNSWMLAASKGAIGSTGAQGPQGVSGPQGPTGQNYPTPMSAADKTSAIALSSANPGVFVIW